MTERGTIVSIEDHDMTSFEEENIERCSFSPNSEIIVNIKEEEFSFIWNPLLFPSK